MVEDSVFGDTDEWGEAAKMLKSVGNLTESQTDLNAGKLTVIDFSATWCGPCIMIKLFYYSLCEKYPDVIFIEVDVDEAQDGAVHCDVKCSSTRIMKKCVSLHIQMKRSWKKLLRSSSDRGLFPIHEVLIVINYRLFYYKDMFVC